MTKPRVAVLTASAALAVMLCGCATQPAKRRSKDKARAALTALVADYQNRETESFLSRFDPDAIPNFAAFGEGIREFLLSARQINLDLIIDSLLEQGTEIAVKAHWDRSHVNAAGVLTRASGRCEFIFRQRASGDLALSDIHGGSPF